MKHRGKYRGWLPLLLFALVACSLAVSLRYRKSPLERFRERIVIGSTRAEVEDALGCPPGDYQTREYWPLMLGLGYWDYDAWTFNGYMILVQFNEQNRVDHFEVYDNIARMDDPRSWWERVFGP